MAKKITDASGAPMTVPVPSIKGVKPVGSQVLVELLTPAEIMGTQLHMIEGANVSGAPQGYVVDVGPSVDPKYGVSKGDRVVLSGSFVPLPEQASTNGRPLAAVEPHTIKAILIEQ